MFESEDIDDPNLDSAKPSQEPTMTVLTDKANPAFKKLQTYGEVNSPFKKFEEEDEPTKKLIEKRSSDNNIIIHKKASLDEKPMDEPEKKKDGIETAISGLSRKENTLGNVKVENLTPSPVPVKSEKNEEVDSMIGILKEKVTQNNSHS